MKKAMTLSLLAFLGTSILSTSPVMAATKASDDGLKAKASVSVTTNPSGTLRMNSATKALDFGTIELNGGSETNSGEADSALVISIIDGRATGAGWHLEVAYDNSDADQAWKTNDNNYLKGAKLMLNTNKSVLTHDGSDGSDGSWTTDQAPEISDSLEISGAPKVYMNSKQSQGMGEWTSVVPNSAISLSVPSASTHTGDYSTTLDWSLVNGPKA